jgi:hypothetical protein
MVVMDPETAANLEVLAEWSIHLTARQGAGEVVAFDELVAYQRSKVEFLRRAHRRKQTASTRRALDEARGQLAALEARSDEAELSHLDVAER